MEIQYGGDTVTVFTISPRTRDVGEYWNNIDACIRYSERHGATGILLFEGNDTYISPWIAAQAAFERSERLCPLVAVNPIYMHPFTVAKFVNSFAQLYGRRTYLNMITGTALSYLQAMNDELGHDRRYDRLREYVEVISALLGNERGIAYDGEFYRVNELKLEPPIDSSLQPLFFFAGASDAATAAARVVDGIQMKMLGAQLDLDVKPGETGIHFGIVTRADHSDAWTAAEALFKEDKRGERVQELTMKNTDSVWKQRMMRAAAMEADSLPGYWLRPFKNFQADCPYFVGSHEEVAKFLAALVGRGVRHIILDLPCIEEEFANVAEACRMAGQRLAAGQPGLA